MVVTFCGHAQFHRTEEYEQKLLSFFDEMIGDKTVEMFLGGYGGFDAFAYECCKNYKRTHPNVSLVFVAPYISEDYLKNHLQGQENGYDSIIYPDIQDKPKKFAISYRNKYMVEMSDYVVAYVSHEWGGAYTSYKYAKRKGKPIFNLAKVNI